MRFGKITPLISGFFLTVFLAMTGCDNDPAAVVCKPSVLQLNGDSLVYRYNDKGRVNEVAYYNVLGRMTKQDMFTYNSKDQLVVIQKTFITITGQTGIEMVHTLSYNENGSPKSLSSNSLPTGIIVTEFTHDSENRLTEASTSVGVPLEFVGATRYEYDVNGNIPKIYYKLNLNGKVTEVLARENLSFDETEKFYLNTPELKITNEYVYSYLPNKNNCLGAKVYYYSYKSRFVTPLSIIFEASYNDEGMIKSLLDNSGTALYSGEILFQRVLYDCH